MTTVAEVLDSSLFDLVVAGAEVSVSSVDASQFIFKMNNLMNSLVGKGVTITWTPVTDLSSTISIFNQATTPVDISDYCIRWLAAEMAKEVAPQYGVAITAETADAIKQGKRSLLRQSRLGTNVLYPTTLPVGSGNEDGVFRDDHFYNGTTSGEGS